MQYKMQFRALQQHIDMSMDKSTVATYRVTTDDAAYDCSNVLLGMRAAGKKLSARPTATTIPLRRLRSKTTLAAPETLAVSKLHKLHEEEVTAYTALLKTGKYMRLGGVVCKLCPCNSDGFGRRARLLAHVERNHKHETGYTNGPGCQSRIVEALYDHDEIAGVQATADYLERSTTIMRATIGSAAQLCQKRMEKGLAPRTHGNGT